MRPRGSIFEWRADTVAMELGRRLARDGGAALVIDYGHAESAVGDTLQAVGRHAYADPLTAPGSIDLTAHVDFQALARAVEAMGANGYRTDRAVAIPAPARHRDARGRAQEQGATRQRALARRSTAALERLIRRGRAAGMGAAVQGRRLRASLDSA